MGKSTFVFTNSSITIDGGSTTINITRDNQSYSHKLSHSYGTITTLAVGTTSYTWAPTAQELIKFFEEIPNQTTRMIDVYLDTYNGSTLVGRYTRSLSVTLSETTSKPTVSVGLEPNSLIIPGITSVRVDDISVKAKYGATIKRRCFVYGGVEYSDINSMMDSFSSQLTTTKKLITFDYKIIDSRGFSNTQSITRYFASYAAPVISNIKFERCNSDGTVNYDGGYAKISFGSSFSNYGSAFNYLRVEIRYSDNPNNPTYSGVVDPIYIGTSPKDISIVLKYGNTDPLLPNGSGGSTSDNNAVPIAFSTNKTYVFSITYYDSYSYQPYWCWKGYHFNNESIINISPDGDITLGNENTGVRITDTRTIVNSSYETKIASDRSVWIDSSNVGIDGTTLIQLYSNGNLNILADTYVRIRGTTGVYIDIPVLISGDCNLITNSGKYYIGDNGSNKPETRNGWLESMKYSTNYCYQVYTTYDGMAKYERMQTAGTWGLWKTIYRRMILSGTDSVKLYLDDNSLYEVSSIEITASSGAYRGHRITSFAVAKNGAVIQNILFSSTNSGISITKSNKTSTESASLTIKPASKTYSVNVCIKQLC